jgi:NAD-dependent dihydropyrimidine dehydrogenase PreA subunit
MKGLCNLAERFNLMYLPVIDLKKCSRCYACVNICPKDVFEINEDEVEVSNPSQCNGCEACVADCPEGAIAIRES